MDLAQEEGEVVATLASALDAFPRGAVVNRPLWQVLWDPDFFGGEEDRAPWADTVGTDSSLRADPAID